MCVSDISQHNKYGGEMPISARVALTLAAVVVAIQAGALIVFAVADFANLDPERISIGIGVGLMLLVLGVGLLIAAVGLTRGRHFARGPVVVTQLLVLALAWSIRSPESNGNTAAGIPWAMALGAAVVLACLASPPAREVLGRDEPNPES